MSMPLPEVTEFKVGELTVYVTTGALKLKPHQLAQAVTEHGPVRGARETKHRFIRGGTILVMSSPTVGVVVATTPEMRAIRKGLATFNPTRVAIRPSAAQPKGRMT